MITIEVLRLENLSKFYTTETSVVVGISGVNLSFNTGEFVALTGESGSGKSTLAHVLGGILPYESGELYVYGEPTSHFDANDWSRYRRDFISFISQSYGILPGNTVSENVESALRLSGLTQDEARTRTKEILDEVELSEFSRRKAGKLSSGQKQRLSIARALAKPSKILIADEPTGNLDRENSEKIISLLKRASKERLVILITHEFEEAKDAATRRIILSDGAVITDAKLTKSAEVRNEEKPLDKKDLQEKKKPLSLYVCHLTLKSRPVFTAILSLLLAVTMFISFVFVGNFIIALDDTPTRVYDNNAFPNGSPERLVVMLPDGEDFAKEDLDDILSHQYIDSIERYGYSADLAYYYKNGTDYEAIDRVVYEPGYHPIMHPDLYEIQTTIQFSPKSFGYLRTLPYTGADIIKEGRAAEGIYEIVSADPEYKPGDKVKVYIRDAKSWSYGEFLELELLVVGTTDFGEGLYFSDRLASALSYQISPRMIYAPYFPLNFEYIFLPYSEELFPLTGGLGDDFKIEDNEFYVSKNKSSSQQRPFAIETQDGEKIILNCRDTHSAPLSNVIFVSENTFDKLTRPVPNQVSVYMKDYSYLDRVMSSLTSDGYISISPYKMGATTINPELATERLVTLAVCALAFIISFILQSILLRAMFSSLFEYYKLMSNTGLTAKIAYGALTLVLLAATLLGEALGALVIGILNAASVERIANIFKFLDTGAIITLFLLHFISVALSLWGILSKLKKSVFGKGKSTYDIDFSLMEDNAA